MIPVGHHVLPSSILNLILNLTKGCFVESFGIYLLNKILLEVWICPVYHITEVFFINSEWSIESKAFSRSKNMLPTTILLLNDFKIS